MNQRKQKTDFIRLVCRQEGEKVDEKMHWAKATLENATQNISALASTTRGQVLGIAAAASLAACSKDEPMPGPQPTTVANTITVLQNPPTTVSGAVGDTLPFFHGKYRALKGDVAVNVHETEDPSQAIRILAHPHPDSTNVAFDTAGTAKMEVKASSARQVEGDMTFSAEEFTKEITADLSVEAKKAAVENFLTEATPVFSLSGPTELELPFALSELVNGGLQLSEVKFTPAVYAEAVNRNGKTVLRLKGPYRGGDAKMTLPNGTVFSLPNMGLDFSAEKKQETMQFLKEQFKIAVLQGPKGNPTDYIAKWNTNPKVWMTGGTEAQREMLKNKILAEFNPILEEAVDAGFTDKLIQFEFVDSKEEAQVPFYLEEGNRVSSNGEEQPGVLGVAGGSADEQGFFKTGVVALYNTETRSDESLIKTTLHEMLRILGMDGEINVRLRDGNPVHYILTSVLRQGNIDLTHLNDNDRFFILAHAHNEIVAGSLPDVALQQYENFIAEPLYEYLKNNPYGQVATCPYSDLSLHAELKNSCGKITSTPQNYYFGHDATVAGFVGHNYGYFPMIFHHE